MSWLVWAVLGTAVVLYLKRFFPSPKGLGGATNALLVEHYLSLHLSDGSIRARLAQMVSDVARASGFPNATDELIGRQFNRHPRYIQLNLIALALDHAGISPEIPKEFWHTVRNPFALGDPDLRDVSTVAARLNAQAGVQLQLGSAPLKLDDGQIVGS